MAAPEAAFNSDHRLVAWYSDWGTKSGAVRIWRVSGTNIQPAECGVCAKLDVGTASSLAAVRAGTPVSGADRPTPFMPLHTVMVSPTGNTIVVVGSQRLFVQDVNSNRIRFRIATTLPVFLTDNLLVTSKKGQELRFWPLH